DTEIVSGVLHKPFDVAELGSLIRHIVKGINGDLAEALRNSQERAIREFVENIERKRSEPNGTH
ncbi:MAG TPA: hypothetical protein VMS56_11700, partial [Thermoanaerobaculia bacterium]|nr:hypothetical protein [Thermoanaerobaculia bacterium]